MERKNLEYYINLPYRIEVIQDAGEEYSGWFARVVELPGCMTEADTFDELGENIKDAMRLWIETALEDGKTIPEPQPVETFSGKFIIRIPRSLHRELSEAAENEGVSLNLYAAAALGKAVGHIPIEKPRVEYDIGIQPAINWPHLSEKARHLLVAHGYSDEVQDVDEQLFASWIDNHLDQIKAAIEIGEYRQALIYVRSLRNGLDQLCEQSPVIRTYCQAIALLEKQILISHQLQVGLVEQDQIKNRVLSEIRTSYKIAITSIEDIKPDEDILKSFEPHRTQAKKSY